MITANLKGSIVNSKYLITYCSSKITYRYLGNCFPEDTAKALAGFLYVAATLFSIGCTDPDSDGLPDAGSGLDGGEDAAQLDSQDTGDDWTLKTIFLDKLIDSEWHPGKAGPERAGAGDGMIDENLDPVKNDRALGPPSGTGWTSAGGDATAVGINGSAAWRFDDDYYIHNGEGPDFITFANHFAWGGEADGLCCELAHVEVSADLEHWYYNSVEQYDVNPDPLQDNDDYVYANVKGLHGNNPTFANHQKDVQAEEIVDGKWEPVEDRYISKDLDPHDPYLGGNRFDLSDFLSKEDGSRWPDERRMKYLRIIDDDAILDGQDWNKDWCLGAQMHAAMGVNFKPEDR